MADVLTDVTAVQFGGFMAVVAAGAIFLRVTIPAI